MPKIGPPTNNSKKYPLERPKLSKPYRSLQARARRRVYHILTLQQNRTVDRWMLAEKIQLARNDCQCLVDYAIENNEAVEHTRQQIDSWLDTIGQAGLPVERQPQPVRPTNTICQQAIGDIRQPSDLSVANTQVAQVDRQQTLAQSVLTALNSADPALVEELERAQTEAEQASVAVRASIAALRKKTTALEQAKRALDQEIDKTDEWIRLAHGSLQTSDVPFFGKVDYLNNFDDPESPLHPMHDLDADFDERFGQ